MRTVILLLISNIFMTFAWYGPLKHLKGKEASDIIFWKIILISWGIAFLEYLFMVPANLLGSKQFTTAQLKMIQEVISLTVFAFFSVLYLKEEFRWNYILAFGCILLGVYFMFKK